MTDISLILLDLNGVLYRYDRAVRVARLASLAAVPPGVVLAAIWASGFEDAGDSGDWDADAYLHGFGVRMGYRLSEADWLEALGAAITPIPETMSLLARLRPDVVCAVLTNNNLLVRRHFGALYPEIADVVGNRAFVSAEFGARKPQPEIYLRCLIRLGVRAEAALFIDDSLANVAGARAAGLAACVHTDPAALGAELQARGLLV